MSFGTRSVLGWMVAATAFGAMACSAAPEGTDEGGTTAAAVGERPTPRCSLEIEADCKAVYSVADYNGFVVLTATCPSFDAGGYHFTGTPGPEWLASMREPFFYPDAELMAIIPRMTPEMLAGRQPFCVYHGKMQSTGALAKYRELEANKNAICAATGRTTLDAYCYIPPVSPTQNPCPSCRGTN